MYRWRGAFLVLLSCLCLGVAVREPSKETDKVNTVKLVINSHVKYGLPREKLLQSLSDIDFANFSNIIVVLGGSRTDRVYVNASFDGLVIAETTRSNFDWTGLSVLWHFRHNALIFADVYIYLLDTCTVSLSFNKHFADMASVSAGEFRTSPLPASSIAVFGQDVVKQYSTNFDQPLSKMEGVWFEFGHSPHGVWHLQHFAQQTTMMAPRVQGELIDIYSTGHPRTAFYYPDLGVTKYIMWASNGDLGGNFRSNGPPMSIPIVPYDLELQAPIGCTPYYNDDQWQVHWTCNVHIGRLTVMVAALLLTSCVAACHIFWRPGRTQKSKMAMDAGDMCQSMSG